MFYEVFSKAGQHLRKEYPNRYNKNSSDFMVGVASWGKREDGKPITENGERVINEPKKPQPKRMTRTILTDNSTLGRPSTSKPSILG